MLLPVGMMYGIVLIALAWIPARLLVAAHRFGGSTGLYGVAILFAIVIGQYWLDLLEGHALTILFCVAPFAAAAATIKAGVGGTNTIRQSTAAGSAMVLTLVIPALLILMMKGPTSASLMAAVGVMLAVYLIWRRWMLEKRRNAPASPVAGESAS